MPKAKELRRVVEPLITLGKDDSDANRRLAFARLRDGEIVDKLFDDLGPRFKARPGGYTRILKMAAASGRQRADGADASWWTARWPRALPSAQARARKAQRKPAARQRPLRAAVSPHRAATRRDGRRGLIDAKPATAASILQRPGRREGRNCGLILPRGLIDAKPTASIR